MTEPLVSSSRCAKKTFCEMLYGVRTAMRLRLRDYIRAFYPAAFVQNRNAATRKDPSLN
jgi:hypothetical protein